MGSICSKDDTAHSSKNKDKKVHSEKVADLENTLKDGNLCFAKPNMKTFTRINCFNIQNQVKRKMSRLYLLLTINGKRKSMFC